MRLFTDNNLVEHVELYLEKTSQRNWLMLVLPGALLFDVGYSNIGFFR